MMRVAASERLKKTSVSAMAGLGTCAPLKGTQPVASASSRPRRSSVATCCFQRRNSKKSLAPSTVPTHASTVDGSARVARAASASTGSPL